MEIKIDKEITECVDTIISYIMARDFAALNIHDKMHITAIDSIIAGYEPKVLKWDAKYVDCDFLQLDKDCFELDTALVVEGANGEPEESEIRIFIEINISPLTAQLIRLSY